MNPFNPVAIRNNTCRHHVIRTRYLLYLHTDAPYEHISDGAGLPKSQYPRLSDYQAPLTPLTPPGIPAHRLKVLTGRAQIMGQGPIPLPI